MKQLSINCSNSGFKMNVLVLLLFIQCVVQTTFASDCSVYEFTAQPPLSLDCDPYFRGQPIPEWRLRLACRVKRESYNGASFEVHWFHKGIDNNVTDLGQLRVTINEINDRQVEFGHDILNHPFNESMLGDYWCHVIHNSSSSSPVYYGISNVLTIYPPDQYNNQSVCSEIPRNFTETCADYPFIPYNTTQTSSVNTVRATIAESSSTIMDPVPSNTATIMIATTPVTSITTQTIIASMVSSDIAITNLVDSTVGPTTTTHAFMLSTSLSHTTMQSNGAGTPSAVFNTPADIFSETNSHLILAASIGGAMLLLIILLLVIIVTLLCATNKRRKETKSDKDADMQRLSTLRSSQRPLLDSNSLSPDMTLVTSYNLASNNENNNLPTTNNHQYSTISDSFQLTPNFSPIERSIINMTDNQYYSTADEISSDFVTSLSQSHSPDAVNTNTIVDETTVYSQNEYSSLKLDKPSSSIPPSDGYNVLWQQQTVPPQTLAYSILYAPDTAVMADEPSQDEGPYNKLVHAKGNVSASKGLVPYETCEIPGDTGQIQPYAQVTRQTNMFDDPRYSVIAKDDKETPTGQEPEKKVPIMPPRYRGDYERDPNYAICSKD